MALAKYIKIDCSNPGEKQHKLQQLSFVKN